jgi:hypothetical protein
MIVMRARRERAESRDPAAPLSLVANAMPRVQADRSIPMPLLCPAECGGGGEDPQGLLWDRERSIVLSVWGQLNRSY